MNSTMTKEEKIKEAWGVYISIVEKYIDQNGFITFWDKRKLSFMNIDYEVCENEECGTVYRPKSLVGIENNNGWLKIESEEDLPKVCDDFLVYNKENEIFVKTFIPNSIVSSIWLKDITHYQPITKPKPPVY